MADELSVIVMAEAPYKCSELNEETQKVLGQAAYRSLRAITKAVTSVSNKIILKELGRAMKTRIFRDKIKRGIMPYLYAATFLSFAGREVNERNIANVLDSIGITPNEEHIYALSQIYLRNHLLYVYTFYFLLSNAKETSDENIRRVVEALGVKFDKRTLDEALTYIDAY